MCTQDSDKKIELFGACSTCRYFAYGVKLDKKAEWASQWRHQQEVVEVGDETWTKSHWTK